MGLLSKPAEVSAGPKTVDWISEVNSPEFWKRATDPNFVSDEELWALRYRLRRETRIRADIVLCPLAEFQEDRDTPNTLAYEAAHFGTSIYER